MADACLILANTAKISHENSILIWHCFYRAQWIYFLLAAWLKRKKKKGTKFIASSAVNAGLYLSHAEGTDRGLSVVGALLKTSLVREQWAETPFQEVLLSTSCHPLAHPWQTSIAPITVLKCSCLQGTTCDTSCPWIHGHQRCTWDVSACSQEAGRRSRC